MNKNKSGPVVLCILDGWGETTEKRGNAILKAKKPTIDKLDKFYPKIYLQASGIAVGLPWGVVGNSEVGHQSMGTGQIIYQNLPIINTSIQDGSFFDNEVLLEIIDYAKKNKAKIHLFGLVSDGGVHSHIEHLFALLELMQRSEFKNVFIHAVTDGRDTAPQSAKIFLNDLIQKIDETKTGEIATISGRYYAMDRSQNWERLEKAYQAMVYGKGIEENDPIKAIENQYKKDTTDEFLEPVVIKGSNNEYSAKVEEGDVFLCFNYRKDRSKQIARVFADKKFNEFEEAKPVKNVKMVCFTEYQKDLNCEVIFPAQEIFSRVGEEIEKAGLSQLRIAETEKFAHVTYFFDGGLITDYKNETKIHIPSKKTDSYAKIPEMSAREVTDKIIEILEKKEKPDFILVNYANPDMVGHTGDLEAGIKAVEFTDKCLEKLIEKILILNGTIIVTADHGNVEEMVNLSTGERDTEHSNNPVPCWLVKKNNHCEKEKEVSEDNFEIGGFLSDLAPTVLDLLKIKKPQKMTGESLLPVFSGEIFVKKEDNQN
jgi:2,3-bisphosphoglycerate-independent phosphoglycerate mutase